MGKSSLAEQYLATAAASGVKCAIYTFEEGTATMLDRCRSISIPLEDRCEDYGQATRYLGTIPECPHGFRLDDHHFFETGHWTPVCGNTAAMLTDTRFGPHFEISGDRSRHYGLFDCTVGVGTSAPGDAVRQAGCCC